MSGIDWTRIYYEDMYYELRRSEPAAYASRPRVPLCETIRKRAASYFAARGTLVDADVACGWLEDRWTANGWAAFRAKEPVTNVIAFVSRAAAHGFQDYEREHGLAKRCDPPIFVKRAGAVFVDIHKQLCCLKKLTDQIVDDYRAQLDRARRLKGESAPILERLLESNPTLDIHELVSTTAQHLYRHVKECFEARPVGESEITSDGEKSRSTFEEAIPSAQESADGAVERDQALKQIIRLAALLDIDLEEEEYAFDTSRSDQIETLTELLSELDERDLSFLRLRFVQMAPRRVLGEVMDLSPSAVLHRENALLERLRAGFRHRGFEIHKRRRPARVKTSSIREDQSHSIVTFTKLVDGK